MFAVQFFIQQPDNGVTSKSSSLNNIQTSYLYKANDSEKVINFILPESVSGYGALTFIIVMGDSACIISINGGLVSTTLSETGVTVGNLLGTITVMAIKESSKVRIKCVSSKTGIPVTIMPLRKDVAIDSAWCSEG